MDENTSLTVDCHGNCFLSPSSHVQSARGTKTRLLFDVNSLLLVSKKITFSLEKFVMDADPGNPSRVVDAKPVCVGPQTMDPARDLSKNIYFRCISVEATGADKHG